MFDKAQHCKQRQQLLSVTEFESKSHQEHRQRCFSYFDGGKLFLTCINVIYAGLRIETKNNLFDSVTSMLEIQTQLSFIQVVGAILPDDAARTIQQSPRVTVASQHSNEQLCPANHEQTYPTAQTTIWT